MKLTTLRDIAELWGYKNDLNSGVLKIESSDTDYCLVRKSEGGMGIVVEVYDTPATLLRDLADYFVGTKTPADFVLKSPRTKKAKYG